MESPRTLEEGKSSGFEQISTKHVYHAPRTSGVESLEKKIDGGLVGLERKQDSTGMMKRRLDRQGEPS